MILGRPGPPGRITVVHEDQERGEDVARLLRPAGHRVQVVAPGPGLVRSIIDGTPDLLIGSAGLDNPPLAGVVRAVRHDLGEVPVIVLVGEEVRDTLVEADEMVRDPPLAGELNLRVGAILRSQMQVRALQRRAKDLQGLWKLSWAMGLESGPEAFYGQLTRQAAEILHAERAVVLLYDRERRWLTAQAEAHGFTADQVSQASWGVTEEDLALWNFRKNGPLVSNHADGDPRLSLRVVQGLGLRSLAAVPLTRGPRIVGLLVVADRAGTGRFSEHDLQLLQGMADGATVGVENLRLHQEIKGANVLLQEYDRLKNEFVAMVAHDFRRPLMSIRGFAELLMEEPDLPADTREEYMRTVMAETDGLARLADDTLLITRIETGELEFQWREIELGPFVLDCLPLGLHDRSVLVEVPPDVPRVVTDPDRVRQVLTNLVSNALKYSPPGEAVRIRSGQVGDFVALEVTDRGPGIPAEAVPRLFQKFSRVRTPVHLQVPGTGLGLYICRLIVEGLGGQVWVQSEEGKGSTFGFTIPLDGPAQAKAAREAREAVGR